jgi:hypothetical protein
MLDVFRKGFLDGSTVQWNGSDRATGFVSSTHLTATISAGDIAAAGIEAVTVFNPLPGGGTSGSQSFYVNTTFLDVPVNYFAATYIDAIFNAGVTGGCGTCCSVRSADVEGRDGGLPAQGVARVRLHPPRPARPGKTTTCSAPASSPTGSRTSNPRHHGRLRRRHDLLS